MKRILLAALILLCLNASAQIIRKRTTLLMGGRFDITISAGDALSAENNIDTVIAEISRIENLISDWKSTSQVSAVNRNAGIAPVKVDAELFALTERAIALSKVTKGAFDISFAAMDRIWKFDGSMTKMPDPEAIKRSVEKVGYRNIILNKQNSTIFLRLKGMKIGFGALGEGYAADRCRKMMLARGIKAGIVNASGDMSTWGKQPNGDDWSIGITNPMKEDTLLAVIPLKKNAVVTSGSYRKFVVFNGKRYAHIINPATGYPATGLISVTVFGPSAEMANGLSTSTMVLGKIAGSQLIKKYQQYSYIIITDKGEILTSKDIKLPGHAIGR
ncbi:FAD:protein FMN transferase [Pedobacter sp. HDW13]|uniref:FAD:protein FMN transferase n=1 Tax=unclassified Pedobacter TaxID=2628915 RepID=UPI000F599E4F|nr:MULTISPECIES: FAD:protein FMN transferase [unclassified Pedobacter]QIL41373.1 FAD:protein FMN transferase [Pedobacter sp. HDW13]RQO78053.1 thiamine biosynthesis protein ApbE [Pedobacter sp. KBW01]